MYTYLQLRMSFDYLLIEKIEDRVTHRKFKNLDQNISNSLVKPNIIMLLSTNSHHQMIPMDSANHDKNRLIYYQLNQFHDTKIVYTTLELENQPCRDPERFLRF